MGVNVVLPPRDCESWGSSNVPLGEQKYRNLLNGIYLRILGERFIGGLWRTLNRLATLASIRGLSYAPWVCDNGPDLGLGRVLVRLTPAGPPDPYRLPRCCTPWPAFLRCHPYILSCHRRGTQVCLSIQRPHQGGGSIWHGWQRNPSGPLPVALASISM